VALATAFTFGSSFQHLFDTPRLYGYSNWDLVAGNPHLDQDSADRVLAMLRADPAITDIGAADILEIVQLGPRSHPQQVSVFAYDAVKGTLGPTILDGRAPATRNEIALASKTLRSLDSSIGDRVEVREGDVSAVMTVVGTTVVPTGFGG